TVLYETTTVPLFSPFAILVAAVGCVARIVSSQTSFNPAPATKSTLHRVDMSTNNVANSGPTPSKKLKGEDEEALAGNDGVIGIGGVGGVDESNGESNGADPDGAQGLGVDDSSRDYDPETQKALEEIDSCQNEIDALNEKASEEIL